MGLAEVCEDVRRITSACDLPLLVDADTGFGASTPMNMMRAITQLEKAGASAIHIEDQVAMKRCGHRPGKQVVSVEEMVERIKAACEGRKNKHTVIMARTDALAVEGFDSMLRRCEAYRDAGADMLFPEDIRKIEQYQRIHEYVPTMPLLANITGSPLVVFICCLFFFG